MRMIEHRAATAAAVAVVNLMSIESAFLYDSGVFAAQHQRRSGGH